MAIDLAHGIRLWLMPLNRIEYSGWFFFLSVLLIMF